MTRKISFQEIFVPNQSSALIRAMKKFIFGSLIILYLLAISACAENNIIYVKSDSSWRATSGIQPGSNWAKTEFDDSSWASSSAKWANNPCSVEGCEYITACTISCTDWMWQGDTCDNCSRYFRKEILVPGDIESAMIKIAADDAYLLYINGNLVVDARNIAYGAAKTYEIADYLHKGSNIMAIKVYEKQNYEGVVVNGEIRFKSIDPVINQMQSKLDILQSQVNTLAEDKKRLNAQVDTLNGQVNGLNSNKENLVNQINSLQSQLISSSNTREELERKLSQQRMINLIFIVILILFMVICRYLHLQNKKLYRKPTLSSVPLKKEEGKK